MRTFLLSLALTCSMAACAHGPTSPLRAPWFNAREFAGLVSAPALDQPARLDFTLNTTNGRELRFTDCEQVIATAGDDIVPAEYPVFQRLKLNCAAYGRYQAAWPARRSNLPETVDKAFIAQLPEAVLPGSEPGSSTVRLGNSSNVKQMAESGEGWWDIQTRTEYVRVTRFAQGDFDHDGVDDMLLFVGWHDRDSFGRGVTMVEITRLVPNGPIQVVSRIRP